MFVPIKQLPKTIIKSGYNNKKLRVDRDQEKSMDISFLVHHWKTGRTLVLFHSVAASEKANHMTMRFQAW